MPNTDKILQINSLLKADFKFLGKEKDLESYILENIHDIALNCNWGEIEKVESQKSIKTKNGRIQVDILIYHKNGTATLIEVKQSRTNKNSTLSAIGQLFYYSTVIKSWCENKPRLVIVSDQILPELYETVKDNNLLISSLMIDGDRCIYLT